MNLLPEKIKSEIRTEYYKRLVTVSIALCSVLLFLGIAPLLLSYMTTTYQIIFLKHEIAAMELANKSNAVVSNTDIVKDLNNKLSILNRSMDQGMNSKLHNVVLTIIDAAATFTGGTSKVRIMSFTYGSVIVKKGTTKTTNYVVNIGGVADSRDTLVKFVKQLETNKMFVSVDLPISNLVDSKSPVFSVGLTLAKNK